MKFRAALDVLQQRLDNVDEPRCGISVRGDEISIEMQFTIRVSGQLGSGVRDGLAVVSFPAFAAALSEMEPGAVEIATEAGQVAVRSGRTEAYIDCIYQREQP